jgi:hypothetical protein
VRRTIGDDLYVSTSVNTSASACEACATMPGLVS